MIGIMYCSMKKYCKKILDKLLNRETILYAIFGVLTALVNILGFKVLLALNIEYKLANFISIIASKVTAYICNKNFVFKSHCKNFLELLQELVRFVGARGLTAVIEYFGVIILIECFELEKIISKIFIAFVVIIINYILGKKVVFKNDKN